MSPPNVVIQTVDHGAVAFLEHGPAVPVLLVCLHEDSEKEHHTPIPTAVQACFELGAGPLTPLVEWRRRDEENKVHLHVGVMAGNGFGVDELATKEVLVTYVKADVDLDLSPVVTTASPPAMKVMQIIGYLFAEIFQRWMFLCTRRLCAHRWQVLGLLRCVWCGALEGFQGPALLPLAWMTHFWGSRSCELALANLH